MVDKLKDKLAEAMFGMKRSAALKKGVCACCKKTVTANVLADNDAREYRISALCPRCFDVIATSF